MGAMLSLSGAALRSLMLVGLALCGLMLGALGWRRVARRCPQVSLQNVLEHARVLWLALPIVSLLLLLQLINIAYPDLAWSAPSWIELYYTTVLFALLGVTLAALFGFAGYGAFATRDRSRFAIMAIALLVLGLLFGIQRDYTAPISARLYEHMRGDVVMQSSGASCAAASAANLARQLGLPRTELQMAELLGTSRHGTSPAQVVHGLGQIGLSCRKVMRASRRVTPDLAPAVLFYPPRRWLSVGHAVHLARVEGTTAIIRDPLAGEIALSARLLARRWQGHAVVCTVPE